MSPPLLLVAGLPVLPGGARLHVAGQAGEARRDGVPLVEAQAAAQRIGAGRAWRALLGGHLQELPRRARERWGGGGGVTPVSLNQIIF